MIKKLRKKFIIISIIAVSSVMVLLFASVNIVSFISTNQKLNNTLDMISSNQGRMPRYEKGDKPFEDGGGFKKGRFDDDFNAETPFATRFFVINMDENGEPVGSNLEQIASVDEEQIGTFASVAYAHGEGYGFTSSYKYEVTKQSDGSYMAVFVDAQKEINTARTLLIVSLAATLVCIGLIGVLIILFSKKAMEPVAQSYQKQKQFITDASHELKTPITVINTSMSVLEMEVGKQKWIDKAKAQCEKLKDLVDSLVTLAKMDEEGDTLQMVSFNVSETVKETVLSFEEFAAAHEHELQSDIAPDIIYKGDEYAVRRLCSVLLDNAVKYADAGTPIRFSLKEGRKGIIISCENACESLDTKELEHLFDRFYRADKARSSETGGFGIGLSIAAGICESHKGSIKAQSDDGKNIRFIATLK
ncbi:MAG: HAMP domain-containing histidine kinase [Clostridia bacterium]|nr:HAMP domain-containing histidine kinase [Clostridia bacterium]